MTVVNNILNLVDLNTKKYNENLQKMKKTTAKETKETANSFKALSNVWTGLIGAISAGAIGSAVVSELKATESAVASFIDSTGSVTKARETFEMLQQAARDTLQPFDALQKSALDLRRNGIEPTSAQMKTFAQIAISSGKNLESVTTAFTNAVQGKYKSLSQLGIVAKDTGDKITLSYKGTTTQIEKSTEALTAYFKKLGEENAGALEYLQNGMTGAINHIENAWGDFVRAIAESGLGDAIAHTIRAMGTALDSITAWINSNQEPIRQFFNRWSDYIDRLSKNFVELTNDLNNFFKASQKVNGSGGKTEPGILGYLNAFAETLGEQIHDLVHGKEPERLFKAERDREMQLFKQRVANLKKGSAEYEQAVWETNERQKAIAKKYENETTSIAGRIGDLIFGGKEDHIFDRKLEEYSDYLEEKDNLRKKDAEREKERAESVKLSAFGSGSAGGGGSSRTATKAANDTWGAYYKKIIDIQRANLSERERLELEFKDKMTELVTEAGQSQTAKAEEIANAKTIIEEQYQKKVEDLRKQAYSFYVESIDSEDLKLQETYENRLSELENYYNQRLLTDEQYLSARQKLYDDYYDKLEELKNSGKDEEFKKEREDMQNLADGFDSLSDAFSNLTDGMNNASSSYKALFAVEKAFAVASATAQAFAAWMKAIGTSSSWYEAIANYAQAIALTTNILTKLRNVEMHDKGGRIPAGQVGIVGEFGPELVTGPANVTSRRETAEMARSAMTGTNVQVNLYEDTSRAGQVEQRQGTDGEQVIDIFVSNIRRGGQVAQALESTYQLHRYGQ
jgi:hypothetical protein